MELWPRGGGVEVGEGEILGVLEGWCDGEWRGEDRMWEEEEEEGEVGFLSRCGRVEGGGGERGFVLECAGFYAGGSRG